MVNSRKVGVLYMTVTKKGVPALRVGSGNQRAAFELRPAEKGVALDWAPIPLSEVE